MGAYGAELLLKGDGGDGSYGLRGARAGARPGARPRPAARGHGRAPRVPEGQQSSKAGG